MPDVPINTIFLLFFILGGAGHMFLLKYNGRHGKKFGINGMIFGMSPQVYPSRNYMANNTQVSA